MDSSIWPGWQTVKPIGVGSFGTVYEIERDVFGETEKAALKVISIPQNQSEVEELLNEGYDNASITLRFQNYLKDIAHEYSLMAKLKGHSNIVYCDDIKYIQNEDGLGWKIYIKMELLTPLMKTLQSITGEKEILKLARDICSALVMCKQFNIVHRDIKPQNIFVSKDGTYKLGDFGIAKTAEKTMGGTKIGTYKYMAPEVYNNQPYGSGADIYSLGMVLYWLLNERRTPFLPLPPVIPSTSVEDEARNRRFRGEALPAPKNGSPALKQVVLKACAYHVKDRYRTAAELLADLQQLSEKQILAAAPVAPVPSVKPEPPEHREESRGSYPAADDGVEDKTESILQRKSHAPKEAHQRSESTPQQSVAETDDLTAPTAKTEASPTPRAVKAEPAKETPAKEEPVKEKPAKEKPTKEKSSRKKLLAIIAALLVVCIAIGVGLWLALSKNRTDTEWSEWEDELPDYVSDDQYEIEERVLYRARTLEKTSSTESEEMDGWELYDSAKGDGSFGIWSDWSEKAVTANADKEVETETRYRYRDKETKTGSQEQLAGWTLYDTKYTYGNYGAWSDWSSSWVGSTDTRKVENKTQYRYRSITATPGYSDWSAWGDWQSTRESTGALKKEDSRNVYGYYYYRCPNCGMHMPQSGTCNTWAGGCGAEIPGGSIVSSSTDTEFSTSDWYGTGYQCGYVGGSLVFKGSTYTQYRYATRTEITTQTYGSWSAWSDTSYTASSTRDVDSRTVYRYCTREQIPTYYFYRWGDWSAWSSTAVKENDDRQVETTPFYRYRERVYTTTYYFQRWTEWTEYSETPIESTEDNEVEARQQYRYRYIS